MMESVDKYLRLLRQELAGSDRATVQDALADAEEYLRTALGTMLETQPNLSEAEALEHIVDEYGSPEEIAAAYVEIETHLQPALAHQRRVDNRPFATRFFGVFADPRAWGALLYMLFSLVTGLVYFTWAVSGLALSLSLMVLIIGLPFAILFLLSVRGIAFVEGRLVEAVLGVRMPRRPAFSASADPGLWERLKALVTNKHTWLSLVYMVVQLPLGICYFTAVVVLVSLSLSLISAPILEFVFNLPIINLGGTVVDVPNWLSFFMALGGVLLLTGTMHLVRLIGRAHGLLAKSLLISEAD